MFTINVCGLSYLFGDKYGLYVPIAVPSFLIGTNRDFCDLIVIIPPTKRLTAVATTMMVIIRIIKYNIF